MTTNNDPQTINFRGYLFFWIGQLQSILGSTIVQFAIVLWIAFETESAMFLALAALLGFAPMVLLFPVAGVLVDRWQRKKVIASMDFLQAFVTIGLVYLFWIGEANVWWVLLVAGLRAIFQAFHMPATQAIMPLMVPREKLSRMNGLQILMGGAIGMIGPPVAALLMIYWEMHEILLFDPITFVFAIIPVLLVRIPEIQKDREAKPSFKSEFTEGVVFIKEKRGLLSLLSVFTGVNFFVQPLIILLPLFVIQRHSGGEVEIALLFAFHQAGMLAGSVLMSTWKGFKNNVFGVVAGTFIGYIGFLLIAVAPADSNFFWMLIIGMIIEGFTIPIANVSSQTIWQQVVPPEKMGRVMSVRMTIAWIAIPLGMILAGIFGELIGIQTLFLICIGLGITLLAYAWFLTGLPEVERKLIPDEAPLPLPTPISES
ncbi:MAG: MFS transporter [Candidatus Hodarchaeales archaeon]|jgi:DHA3 family macrolide efflux protein-like MFS transporter